jgi:hypothetical protein
MERSPLSSMLEQQSNRARARAQWWWWWLLLLLLLLLLQQTKKNDRKSIKNKHMCFSPFKFIWSTYQLLVHSGSLTHNVLIWNTHKHYTYHSNIVDITFSHWHCFLWWRPDLAKQGQEESTIRDLDTMPQLKLTLLSDLVWNICVNHMLIENNSPIILNC